MDTTQKWRLTAGILGVLGFGSVLHQQYEDVTKYYTILQSLNIYHEVDWQTRYLRDQLNLLENQVWITDNTKSKTYAVLKTIYEEQKNTRDSLLQIPTINNSLNMEKKSYYHIIPEYILMLGFASTGGIGFLSYCSSRKKKQ